MKMGSGTTKKAERVERKKKKLNALLEITKLNDKDRIKEHSKLHVEEVQNSEKYVEEKEEGEIDDRLPSAVSSDGPHCKRHKTNDGHVSYRHNGTPKESNKNNDSNIGSDKPFIIPTEELVKLRKELRERRNKLKAGNYARYDYWSYRKPNTYFPFPRKHGMRPCTYNALPRLLLNEMGEKALLTRDNRTPLFITDIQHLIMYSQLANLTPVQPRWCSFEKITKLSHTVLLVVEGPTVYDYLSSESSYPFLAGMNHRVEIVSPTSYDGNLVEELATVPLSRSQKDKLEKKYGSLSQAELNSGLVFRILRSIFPIELPACRSNDSKNLPGGNKFSRTELLLSAWQMIEEGYPIPVKGELMDRYADYVMTKEKYAAVTPTSPMWGLDCEMCFTSIRKNELTRVSIVDEDHKVVYESLVKPHNRIIDYLTQFSGITKEMMKNVTKTLEDVQQELRQLLPADVILVGQSLNFDLHALKLMHPYVIDTSVIYNITGFRPRKTKLAVLAEQFLGELIQTGHGHDSVEDSSSSLKLVQLKLANSVEFGDAVLSGQTEVYNPCNKPVPQSSPVSQNKTVPQSKLVPQNKSNSMKNSVFATSLFSHVIKNDKTAVVVGKDKVLSEYRPLAMIPSLNESCKNETRVKCESIENNNEAIAYACVESQYQSFLLAHLQLDNNESLSDVNVWCNQLYESLAANAFFVMILAGRPYSKAHGACFVHIKGPNYNVSKQQQTCSKYNNSA